MCPIPPIKGHFNIIFACFYLDSIAFCPILDYWEQTIKDQWQIASVSSISEGFNQSIDEDVYQYVRKMLPILEHLRREGSAKNDPNYQIRFRSDLTFEHDAHCLGLIANHRKSSKTVDGKKPKGPWFLTFDNLLSALNASYYIKDDFGLAIQPRTLLNYLLIYSKIQFKKEDIEAVAEAIIRFTARTPDPKLTFDEYIRMVIPKIGLEGKDIEIVKEIFLASPLKEELKRAVELDHGYDADNFVYKIITNEPFIKTVVGERKTIERLKVAAELVRKKNVELAKKDEELIKEKAAKEALEKALKQNISITVIANIDVNIKSEVNSLINLLEAENAFKDGLLEKPTDTSKIETLKSWLNYAKSTIETSTAINEGVRAILPFITHLIAKLNST